MIAIARRRCAAASNTLMRVCGCRVAAADVPSAQPAGLGAVRRWHATQHGGGCVCLLELVHLIIRIITTCITRFTGISIVTVINS